MISSLDPLKLFCFDEIMFGFGVSVLDRDITFPLAQIHKGCGHQILVLRVELRDPADVRAEQAQRVRRSLDVQVVVAGQGVRVCAMLNIYFDNSTVRSRANPCKCYFFIRRGTYDTWERNIIIFIVTLAFQIIMSQVNVRNRLIECLGLLPWICQRDLRDG